MPMCLVACVGEKQNVVLDTFIKGIENPNSVIDKAVLNPSYRYLKVDIDGQPALLVLGYQEQTPNGTTDTWYSSFKEMVQITGGRLTGTQGLDLNWTEVTLQNPPSLTNGILFKESNSSKPSSPIRYQRVHTLMPSYRANIAETVELQVLSKLPDDAPSIFTNAEEFPHLRWVQETVVMQTNVTTPFLSPLRAIYAVDTKTSQVIYGKQCLRAEHCISWFAWPINKAVVPPKARKSPQGTPNS